MLSKSWKVLRKALLSNVLRSNVLLGAGMAIGLVTSGQPNPFASSVAQADPDSKALQDLQTFLFNATERKAFASGSSAGRAAEADLSRYPPEVQRELLEIVMLIMNESNGNPGSATLDGRNPAAAMGAFSPRVQERIKALARKLSH